MSLSSNVVAILKLFLMLTNCGAPSLSSENAQETRAHRTHYITMAVNEVRVLNEGNLSEISSSQPAVGLSKELQRLMLKIKGCFMSEDGRGVDYTALKTSKLFEEYQTLARDLQLIATSGMTVEEKIAFFLSILYYLNHDSNHIEKWVNEYIKLSLTPPPI